MYIPPDPWLEIAIIDQSPGERLVFRLREFDGHDRFGTARFGSPASDRPQAILRLRQLLADALVRLGVGRPAATAVPSDAPPRLAVYVTAEDPPALTVWSIEISALLKEIAPSNLAEVVACLGDQHEEDHPRFPLRVVATDASSDAMLEHAIRNAWYFTEPTISRHGLQISPGVHRLGARGAVLVTSTLGDVDPTGPLNPRQWRGPGGPFLILVTGAPPVDAPLRMGDWRRRARRRSERVPAILYLGKNSGPREVRQVLDGLVHDLPLHRIAYALRREQDTATILFAGPISNQALRLGRWKTELFARADKELTARNSPPDLRSQVERLKEKFRSFEREGAGLMPLSELAAFIEQLPPREPMVALQMETIAADAEPPRGHSTGATATRGDDQPSAPAPRSVDAELCEVDENGAEKPLDRQQPLRPRGKLKLRMQIGRRFARSLFTRRPRPISSLMPALSPGETHELYAILFPKDFRLGSNSPATQRLTLAYEGPSSLVEWDLTVPEVRSGMAESAPTTVTVSSGRDCVSEPHAELRVGFYFRNRLLQSFALSAALEGAVLEANQPAVTLACDFSQTEDFARLGELSPRLISLALNRDGNGSHTLMVADEGEAVALNWSEGQMRLYTDAVRTVLFDAISTDRKTERFPFDPATQYPPDPKPAGYDDAHDQAIRRLADVGGQLYAELLLQGSDTARDLLSKAKGKSRQRLEITRLDPNYAFPWPLLYDYVLPPSTELAAAPVCRGVVKGAECACAPDTPGICMRGFWGIRHVVEQIARHPAHEPPVIPVPPPPAPTVSVLPVVKDRAVQWYLAQLPTTCAGRSHVMPDPQDLLEQLRPAKTRAPLFVFIGHQAIRAAGNVLPIPELRLPPPGRAVGRAEIAAELQKHKAWNERRSLVLLLACGSGTTRVDTGASLASSLLELGAGGVVGTECTVFTSLAVRVAHELQQKLLGPTPLAMGEALRSTVADLAARGCPAGLAFTYLGSAELHLAQLP